MMIRTCSHLRGLKHDGLQISYTYEAKCIMIFSTIASLNLRQYQLLASEAEGVR